MMGRPCSHCRGRASIVQNSKVVLGNEDIDDADQIVLGRPGPRKREAAVSLVVDPLLQRDALFRPAIGIAL